MKTSFLNLLALFVISTILFSCSPEDDGVYFNENSEVINTSNVSYSVIEYEILEEIDKFSDEVFDDLINDNRFSTIQKSKKIIDELVNWQWLMLLIIGLLSLEWFIRKYIGKI